MEKISRRKLLKMIGLGGLTGVVPASGQTTPDPTLCLPPRLTAAPRATSPPGEVTYLFFNPAEASFLEAALARLIPSDPQLPGALDANVHNFIDKQLSGAWGAGERLFLGGPWKPSRPGLGYQLPFTPAELFHTAIAAINAQFSARQTTFAALPPDQQDAYLRELEDGKHDLAGIPSEVFFKEFLELTMEGFFSDPVYGGNKDLVVWKMIGFPGAYADYYDLVDKHGISVDRPPVSLAQHNGHVHVHPDIPANLNGS